VLAAPVPGRSSSPKEGVMFHRRQATTESTVAPLGSHTVRILKDNQELQEALERARDFERRGVDAGQRRVGTYERVLVARAQNLAPVVPIIPEMDSGG
jgi:hypothetical protein